MAKCKSCGAEIRWIKVQMEDGSICHYVHK